MSSLDSTSCASCPQKALEHVFHTHTQNRRYKAGRRNGIQETGPQHGRKGIPWVMVKEIDTGRHTKLQTWRQTDLVGVRE